MNPLQSIAQNILLSTKQFSVVLFLLLSPEGHAQAPCSSIINVTCDSPTSYALSGAGLWNPPGPWGTPGDEQIFTFTPSTSGNYTITTTNNNYYVDLFYKTGACDDLGWTYVDDIYTSANNTINLTAGTTYYFLLDDENTTPSSGTFTINCPCLPLLGGFDTSIAMTTASFVQTSTTIGACNDCNFRASNDRTYQIEIFCEGDYTFTTCDGASWDTYLYLNSNPCGGTLLASNDDACGLQSSISTFLTLGTYYLTVEGYASSSVGNFELNITSTCTFVPLAVELTSFFGKNQGSENVITWETQSEQNNDHFILEKSEDAYNFQPIGLIEGAGTTQEQLSYVFVDAETNRKSWYYRLLQVDNDGKINDEGIIFIPYENNDAFRVFPQPFTNTFTIDSPELLVQPTLLILNSQGQVVKNMECASFYSKTISFNGTPGIYFLKIIAENKILNYKLEKQ